MEKPNIGIVGYGIVGNALGNGFKDYANILFYDKFKESTPLEELVSKSEFIFICVPTPMKADESGIDLSIVEEVIDQIAPLTKNTDKIIIIKSTSTPGTTKKYQEEYPDSKFAYNPEFLTEANYLDDFINADRTVLGAADPEVSEKLAALYQGRFRSQKIFQTDTTSAEMVKYMANAYLATKVIFANEMFDLCQKLGIDYSKVKNIVVADHRIFDSHLDITPLRGFGGKCFPKDMVALIASAKALGVDVGLLEKAWEINKEIRTDRDWEEIPGAVSETPNNNNS
jgi:nucleotide sugar dehydrogenase